jgi:hypothetical protein
MPGPPEPRRLTYLQANPLVDTRPEVAPLVLRASPRRLRLENRDAASPKRPRRPAAAILVGGAGPRRVRLESVSTPNAESALFC